MNKRFYLVLVSILVFSVPVAAYAARLTLKPSTATVVVGGTFSVSVSLDTEGESINALDVTLKFPADKLQVVSPSLGRSVVSVWTAPPYFNNATGELHFQGGIPGGINVKDGLISTITFRAKKPGSAVVKFDSDSQILAHDGKGTDVLTNTQSGIFDVVLPPPEGPIIASETHPDSSRWYRSPTAILKWTSINGIEYSYVLNREPVDIPDNISEGTRTGVAYKNLADGIHYFHIKAKRGGVWGGISHFAVNVDTSPPAEFPVRILPAPRTTSNSPIIQFDTTDASSGISYYEYAVIPFFLTSHLDEEYAILFTEVSSPHVLDVKDGKFAVIVRAYDAAGNYQESVQRLRVMSPALLIATSTWAWLVALLLVALLGYGVWSIREWYENVIDRRNVRNLPTNVRQQLKKLKRYERKYKKFLVFLILGFSMFSMGIANAVTDNLGISPPFVGTISDNITNEDIFYIGGRTDSGGIEVIIYLQNLRSGETLSEKVTSDRRGDWFYRHSEFLGSGEYLLWTQAKLGDEMSPPSPQIRLSVEESAIQFGASLSIYIYEL